MGGGREEGVGGETVAGLDGLEVCRICGYRHTHIDVCIHSVAVMNEASTEVTRAKHIKPILYQDVTN